MNNDQAGVFSLRNLLIATGCLCVACLGVKYMLAGPIASPRFCLGIIFAFTGGYAAAGAMQGKFTGATIIGVFLGSIVAAMTYLMRGLAK